LSSIADLVVEALSAGLLLSRNGEHIHVDSPLGRPLPDDLRDRLLAHQGELLAWLDWCERADEELLGCSRRLARCYPPGCPLEGAEWQAAEESLHAAHRSQDEAVWRSALAGYEIFALRRFADYRKKLGPEQCEGEGE